MRDSILCRAQPCLATAAGFAALAIAGCGGGGSGGSSTPTTSVGPNASHYVGPKRAVAAVIDELQANARSGDGTNICRNLFTPRLAGTIAARNNVSCPEQVKAKLIRKDASFVIASIKIRGKQAVAKVTDFTGTTNGMYFVDQNGWKIDSIYSLTK